MTIERNLIEEINSFEIPVGSKQRTIGDLLSFRVQEILKDLNSKEIKELVLPKSKKSMENFTLVELDETLNYFNIVTYDSNAKFSMPNLTSINRIRDIFMSKNENLFYIFITYEIYNQVIRVQEIVIKSIWDLDFNNLRIGSLGKGQLQIKNMHKNNAFIQENRISWFKELTNLVKRYHETRIKQIHKDSLLWA